MANVSSVPRAKAALLTMMTAVLGTVQVTWAFPQGNVLKECAFMADAEFEGEEETLMRSAPRPQDETYVVPVWVSILSEGNDVQAAEERCWTLVGLIESAIRADQTLGGMTNLHYAKVVAKVPRNGISDQGWVAECMIRVKVHART